MTLAASVTFDGVESSEALRAAVLEHASRLERFADDLLSCHVVVGAVERHHRSGPRFGVRVRVTLPGGEIEASSPAAGEADPYVAVAAAFDAVRRRIEDRVRRRRGDVKAHARD